MDKFEDIENTKPGAVISVSTADGLHVVGIVEAVDHEARALKFADGRVVTFGPEEAAPVATPEAGEA